MLEGRPKLRERPERVPSKRRPGKWSLYLLFLAAAGLLVAGGVAIHNAQPAPTSARQQVIHMGQLFVRQSVSEGLRASFAGEEETVVEDLPDHKFMVSGWVDLITNSGQQDRKNYSVVVHKNFQGWVGERVSVIPQM